MHGLFADGSCWSEVIARLQAAGLNATAVQNPLTTLDEAVAATRRVLARQDGPTVLAGHSFAGMIVTEIGVDPSISALVCVAARAPDTGEDYTTLAKTFPTPPASCQKSRGQRSRELPRGTARRTRHEQRAGIRYRPERRGVGLARAAPARSAIQGPSAHDQSALCGSVVDAILYLLRTGCQWRLLPRCFPPWGTVYHYFRLWGPDGRVDPAAPGLVRADSRCGRPRALPDAGDHGRPVREDDRAGWHPRVRRAQAGQGQEAPHPRRHAGSANRQPGGACQRVGPNGRRAARVRSSTALARPSAPSTPMLATRAVGSQGCCAATPTGSCGLPSAGSAPSRSSAWPGSSSERSRGWAVTGA